jgi:hypothetical protein
MVFWYRNFFPHDGDRFYGLRIAVGANELLGGDCYNKPFFCHTRRWYLDSSVALGRIFG